MLRLLAVAYHDAYAIVQDGERLLFIRPPFTSRQMLPATRDAVDRAVEFHGFIPTEGTFQTWADLIAHLKDRALEARQALGEPPPDPNRIRRLVEIAPADIVAHYLDRIQNELLPNREFSAARSILCSLLRNPAVKQDPASLDRCSRLLEASNRDPEIPPGIVEDPAAIFPLAGPDAPAIAKQVRDARQVILIAA